jgi:hypothetical protein
VKSFWNLTLKNPFVISCIILIAIFILTFPRFYTSTDEKEYIENAYLLTEGELVRQDSACYLGAYCGYFNGSGWVSKYNLGWSLILLPFVLVDWRLSFVLTFGIFLSGFYIFKKILKFYKVNSNFLYLYAFFPAFVYYSRKPLTETLSNTLVLALYYLIYIYKSKTNFQFYLKYILIGLVSGLLVLERYSNIIIVLIFLGSLLYKNFVSKNAKIVFSKERLTKPILILLGSLPFLITFLAINKTFYGGFFSSGYDFSGEEFLIDKNIILKQFFYYILFLNLIYPLLLFSLIKTKLKGKLEIIVITILFLMFYVGFPGYHFNSGILDLVFGVRFFIPILGLLLLSYCEYLNKVWNKVQVSKRFNQRIVNLSYFIVVVLLIGNAFLMSFIYENRTAELKKESDGIYLNNPSGAIVYTQDVEDRILLNEAFRKKKLWMRNPDWEKYFNN